MSRKEEINKYIFNIENFGLPRYLYKLDSNSKKVYNTSEEVDYLYNVIKEVVEKNNLIINKRIEDMHSNNVSRDFIDEYGVNFMTWEEDMRLQYEIYFKFYVLVKELMKVCDEDLTLIGNFYNNTYFSTKEDARRFGRF